MLWNIFLICIRIVLSYEKHNGISGGKGSIEIGKTQGSSTGKEDCNLEKTTHGLFCVCPGA